MPSDVQRRRLVVWFTCGIVLGCAGVALIPLNRLIAALVIAIGASTVVLSILRGEDVTNAE